MFATSKDCNICGISHHRIDIFTVSLLSGLTQVTSLPNKKIDVFIKVGKVFRTYHPRKITGLSQCGRNFLTSRSQLLHLRIVSAAEYLDQNEV